MPTDVKKDELLFRIDPRPYEAVLASAKADLVLAQANLKRQTELQAKSVTARSTGGIFLFDAIFLQ